MLGALLAVIIHETEEANLGLTVRAPTPKEAKEYALPVELKRVGMMVESVDPGGPADRAGIRIGDALLRIDENRLHSQDNVDDFLRVTPPGKRVKLRIKRAKTFEEEEIPIALGRRAMKRDGIAWQFASLEQLAAALAQAKAEGKLLLVGLSGAET